MSRRLRSLLFSYVVGTLLVSMLIVSIQFIWDTFVAGPFNRPVYNPKVEFILPAILIIGYLIHRYLWDAAEGRLLKKPMRA